MSDRESLFNDLPRTWGRKQVEAQKASGWACYGCALCREPLPRNARTDRMYCGQRCGGFAHRVKKFFRVSLEEYHALWDSQDGKCAACHISLGGLRERSTHLDHCHETGALRGFLHQECNQALGMMGEDPERLMLLATYARKHNQLRLVEEAA